MPMKTFADYLSEYLTTQKIRPADLARNAGMDSGVVSNLLSGKRMNPSHDSCRAIARALHLPIEEVYRWAGYLDEKPDSDPITDIVVYLMLELESEDRQDVLHYVRLRHQIAAENRAHKKNRAGNTRKAEKV